MRGGPGVSSGVEAPANQERLWLTAEEFLAQVEAHKAARERERLKPRAVNETPSKVRIYYLDWTLKYKPRPKPAADQGQEVTP